ncbi:MAG TPA: hypothetical protein VGF99_05435 [Myxococcota bacterium]
MRHISSLCVAVVVAAVVGGTAACSVIWATTSSEENLACGPDDGSPRCLDGFACVPASDGVERCVRAGFKAVGEECVASEECADGAVCADAYAELCQAGSTDPNCARLANVDTGLRCRAPCAAGTDACDAGTRCFFFEDKPAFCQAGICATDSDCTGGGVVGICVGETEGGGRDGLCAIACSPLDCFERNANCGCAAEEACAQPPDEALPSARNICQAHGELVSPSLCGGDQLCADGYTCAARVGAGDFVCTQWCRVGGGAPECNNAGRCQNADLNVPALGICPAT